MGVVGWGVSGPALRDNFKMSARLVVNIRQITLIVVFFLFQKYLNDKPAMFYSNIKTSDIFKQHSNRKPPLLVEQY